MSERLVVKDLSYAYPNGRKILENINFSLNDGDILSIIGPNGAGKSTLLNCLCGVFTPKTGEIIIDGIDISQAKVETVAKHVGYMRQNTDIVYDFKVRDVVLMGRAPYVGPLSLPSAQDKKTADEAIVSMGIDNLSDRLYTELSGGEKQKVLIARLITQQPRVIVMDEPTSALDYGNQRRTLDIIRDLSSKGYVIIMTTHNPDHALQVGGKVALISKDRDFVFGDGKDILKSETLSKLYGVNIRAEYVESFGREICSCV